MSLLPSVEHELMRVARAPTARRLPAGVLVAAVAMVALAIGAGFLVALHGARVGGGSPATPAPPASRGLFPGAPRTQRVDIGRDGYRCRPAARNRYLPSGVGCVTVLRAAVVPGDSADLVVMYARLARHAAGGFPPGRYTLELIRPSGAVARTPLPATDVPPTFLRVGAFGGVAGQQVVLHLDDISSGDTYAIAIFSAGRPVLARPLLSAGGDSVLREGFACRLANGDRQVILSRTMVLLASQPVDGRWRWTVRTFVFHGPSLFEIGRGSFIRRGLPGRRFTPAGAGCGRPVGAAPR